MSDFMSAASRRGQLLVSPRWLHEHLDDEDLRIIDCSAQLVFQPVGPSRVESGRPAWLEAHIPGARYLNMATDLSDPQGAYAFTMPTAGQVAAVLGALGVSEQHRIVLYGSGYVGSVTRIWYILHACGFRHLSLLDGGFEQWKAEGRPLSSEEPALVPVTCRTSWSGAVRSQWGDVAAAIHAPGVGLINALSRDQFLGRAGTHYGRPGRIPSSLCIPARELLEADGRTFRPDGALRQLLCDGGLRPDQQVIAYCGGGIAATIVAFALAMLGHERWSVYDHSLNEWATRADLPMVCGEQTGEPQP